MRETETLEYEIARGREAQRTMSVLETAFANREEQIYDEFRRAVTDHDRLVAQTRLHELGELQRYIDSVIASGRLAAQSLDA